MGTLSIRDRLILVSAFVSAALLSFCCYLVGGSFYAYATGITIGAAAVVLAILKYKASSARLR